MKDLEKRIREEIAKGGDKAIAKLLAILEDEVYEMATHAEMNWQDYELAEFWLGIGRSLESIRYDVECGFGYEQLQ